MCLLLFLLIFKLVREHPKTPNTDKGGIVYGK